MRVFKKIKEVLLESIILTFPERYGLKNIIIYEI